MQTEFIKRRTIDGSKRNDERNGVAGEDGSSDRHRCGHGANCIPCFEHLYEKAVTSGITMDEIRRASEIAGLVKSGAHAAISGSIDELIGPMEDRGPAAVKTASGCRCR